MHYQRKRKHGDVSIRSIPRVATCATCGIRFDPGEGRARKYCGRACKPSGRIAGSVNMRRWVDKLGNEDGWVCWLCGELVDPKLFWPHQYAGSVDHVVPASRSGTDERRNLRLAHLTCNCSRKDKLIEEDELG
jgi:5-methylcytosine-specific restriction endonuclease McrA